MHPTGSMSFRLTACCLALGLAAASAAAAPPHQGNPRTYDRRIDLLRGAAEAPAAAQLERAAELRRQMPDLLVTYDPVTAAVRSLSNAGGPLSGPHPGAEPLAIAEEFLAEHLDLLGLSAADLAELEVTDVVPSEASGVTHLYLRQMHRGLPVYNAQLQVHLDAEGRVLSVNSDFLPDLALGVGSLEPRLDAAAAVAAAAKHVEKTLATPPRPRGKPTGAGRRTVLDARDLSLEPIEARLALLPVRRADARLVWNFQVYTLDEQHVYDLTVDAATGEVLTRYDWVASDSYRVYPRPVESPNHTTPLPPADGRVLLTNPAFAPSSPFAWHDTNGVPGAEFTIMRGNNVHAYEDSDANGLPPAVQPDCGPSIVCDFPINLAGQPSTYRPAAVANLFYWNNLIHDIQAQYGFTSAAGNFQVNTYGAGGLGNDDVRAEAQDGGGINNANFLTLPDGQRPRMQMFLWNTANPQKDGDLDSGVIVHEYGHGISNRLVGGPLIVTCLQNLQQPGEGLSDWWSLVYTHERGDQGTDGRGIGTYVLNQPVTGLGIRTQKYSTDPTVNTWTYASIAGMIPPHGVGSVWAQGAWEVYWRLVDRWGFDPNLYDALGGAGNQRMNLYATEGLKYTACSPTFTQTRDGFLQAAALNYGSQDVCRMWKGFAAFGLGSDAISGGPNNLNVTNGFATPASCACALDPFHPVIVHSTQTSATSFAVSCPAGTLVVGGGCSDDFTSTILRSSAPQGNNAWSCSYESNPGSLTAWALCEDVPVDNCRGYEIVNTTTTTSNVAFLKCPNDKIVLGGGCRDNTNSSPLQSTYPWGDDGWVCNWQNVTGSLTAYAICGGANLDTGLAATTHTETFSNVSFVQCPAGKKVVSGGCSDDFTSTTAQSSFPWNDNGWICNWTKNPGSLTVYALCEDP